MSNTRILLGSIFLGLACSVIAANPPQPAQPKKEKPPLPTFLTPEEAGQDYLDQGEYTNDWGGAQVIALGNNRFRLVTYKGGLPGAGWDKSPKTEVEGKRDGDAINFPKVASGFSYRLAKGTLTAISPDGNEYTMKKTERKSPTLGAKPPAGAIVLFNGSNADAWRNAHLDQRNLLQAGTSTKRSFTNFTLHLEFLLPFKPEGRGQDRGNSGVYLQDRYEVQVLDSFGLAGKWDECGGVYSQAAPLVNMCFPPLTWQTYDIDYTAAVFDASGKKVQNAKATVRHNGVVIHDSLEFKGSTGGGKKEGPDGGAIQLQGHGNPVFYRNIWIVEK